MPAIPHFTQECLEDLDFKKRLNWPVVIDKYLTKEMEIDYVIQINGKKRAILNENRDIDQESLLSKIKKINYQKYLKDKLLKK